MSMHLGNTTDPRCEINVTPMIDLLLVLIVIFMLISPGSQGLTAEIPQDHPPDTPPPKIDSTIVVQVLYNGVAPVTLKINQNDVTWQKLPQRLRDIYKTRAEKVMFVRGDPQITFTNVALVIDAARVADREIKVGLITAQMEGAGD